MVLSHLSTSKKLNIYFCIQPTPLQPNLTLHSIIICDTTKVIIRTGVHGDTTIVASYKNKTEYLSKRKLGTGSEKIYDCAKINL